jgi:hypothetical protein
MVGASPEDLRRAHSEAVGRFCAPPRFRPMSQKKLQLDYVMRHHISRALCLEDDVPSMERLLRP